MRSRLRTPRAKWHTASTVSTILITVGLTGCSQIAPNSPLPDSASSRGVASTAGVAPAGAFFPLGIGSWWHATGDDRLRVEPIGGGPPIEEFTTHRDIVRTLIGTEILFGRSYVVQEEAGVQTGGVVGPEPWHYTNWVRYRQDASGLYEADVGAGQPPVLDDDAAHVMNPQGALAEASTRPLPAAFAAGLSERERSAYEAAWQDIQARAQVIRSLLRASMAASSGIAPPGGVLSEEITRLRYPLRPGAEWVIRADPLFTSTVEQIEVLDVPAGKFPSYRVRIGSEFFHPDEFAHVWFGRSGQLALRYHLVGIATDVNGNEIGRLVIDYDEVLEHLGLVRT